MPTATLETKVGLICVREEQDAITRVFWAKEPAVEKTPLLDRALSQLEAYFTGELTEFDLPLEVAGGAFQQAVCDAMLAIPYGQTRSYGEIAKDLDTYGQPVGAACGANPIPIIIPCHRVLSANGLGGFSGAGGVETKIALLRHEGGYPFLI